MQKQFNLTKEGVAELEEERKSLISERGPIAERIKSARELGDLAENAEYSAAKAEQDRTETRIGEIEYILKNSKVISAPKNKDKVELGNTVELKGDKGDKTFTIVGSVEADPLNGKVSDESPIGKSLIGKKLGEQVEIVTPASKISYKIAKIS